MLIRISLIVAILAGLAVGVLNFVQVKEKIVVLQDNLKKETDAHHEFETKYTQTKKSLDKTTADLNQTKSDLNAATEAKNKAVADLDKANKNLADLTATYNTAKKERDDFQADLSSYKQVFPTSVDAVNAGKLIKSLQDQLAGSESEKELVSKDRDKIKYQLEKILGTAKPVLLPKELHGKILVFDPKWEFVVLDIGEEKGVKEDGELLVSRDGKLVAKIVVRSVDKNRSIANIVPDWKLGEIIEGDLVVPANPGS
jgi:myosin heavy subunit